MRLLRRDEDGRFSFTKDLVGDDLIPPYVILSHTWGKDDEEVTLEDIANGTGEDKPGYEKIRFCGEQANQDGLQHFWIDTCCINKKDDAELSRSINSMFHWYRNAIRCYVYLSDVVTRKRKRDEDSTESWELEFRRSRWFTRGWTLQELLAPTSVEFFSRERKRLGDKSSLRQQIHEITNIPPSALQGNPLSYFGVKERLQWIEHRQTTLEEDKAYSLLGLFGVYILPIYGEGKASAFKRLQKEIDRLETCTKDLRLTDPRDDKNRIEDTKGGLLEDSYSWIIENSEFRQWRNDQQSRLLWVKGDPGKGKTMLLCGIINNIKTSVPKSDLLSYFFCQATDSQINNATAVLRGLIYMLVNQQPSLLSHVLKKYEQAGKLLFEDVNAWVALSEILTNILQDPNMQNTFLVVDALDECTVGLPALLNFIVQTSSASFRVKWLVSGRNWPQIEERLEQAGSKVRLSLELNAESISAAVNIFIQHKVRQLAQEKKYDNKTQDAVLQHLFTNADGTFLWVALVCQNLKNIPRGIIRARLTLFPPGLDSFYERMMTQIYTSDYSELCKRILATIATVYEPITLAELASLVEMLEDTSDDLDSLHEIIGLCGSFLTIRKGTIYFVHQSAKDYLLTKASNGIFPSGRGEIHYEIFFKSLEVMSRTLRRDMYSLCAMGYLIEQVVRPDPDPLASSRYSCINWLDHLLGWSSDIDANYELGVPVKDAIETFMRTKYLYWLEALSLYRSMSKGVVSMAKLEVLLQDKVDASGLLKLVQDGRRFIMSHKLAIENSPLQAYASALLFSPARSLIRRLFEYEEPNWINIQRAMPDEWSACLQTLEGHSSSVRSVAFSHDSARLASASDDNTVKIWDARSGACLQTLEGHSSGVSSVAFSADSTQLASASLNDTVKIWDASSAACLQTLEGHSGGVSSVAFSADSTQLASASVDNTVKIWDASSGVCLQTLEGHSDWVYSVAFSHDSARLASASYDNTVKIWDASSGDCLQTLMGHSSFVYSGTFSHDSARLVSASFDKTIKIWDTSSGDCLQTLEGHSGGVSSVAFSADSTQLASASVDNTVKIWNASSGVCLQTLEGHSGPVYPITFSHDSAWLASASKDNTVKIWDAGSAACLQTLEGHSDSVDSVVFSHNSARLVSVSSDKTVMLWDTSSCACLQTLEGHNNFISSIALSHNFVRLASASYDQTVKIWDASNGTCLQTLEGHSSIVTSVVFSHDSVRLASASYDETVKIWDASSGACLQTLEGHYDIVTSIAFSHDSTLLASVSEDNTVMIWDASSGDCLQTLEGHSDKVSSVAFSADSTQLASSSEDNTVKIWDASSGVCLQTLEGHSDWVYLVAFSHDSARLASASYDNTVKIWDTSSGDCLQTLEAGTALYNISFDTTGLYLHTEIGSIILNTSFPSTISTEMKSQVPQYKNVGLSSDRAWITHDSKKVLWLPLEYRPSCSAISTNTIAMGVGSGKVWICNLNANSIRDSV